MNIALAETYFSHGRQFENFTTSKVYGTELEIGYKAILDDRNKPEEQFVEEPKPTNIVEEHTID